MPENRAVNPREQSTRGRTDTVRLAVEGIQLDAKHGVHEDEREQGNRFRIDVEMWADVLSALESDRLEDTVDHAAVVRIVEEVSKGRQFNLIESFAHEISIQVIERFPQVMKTLVRVRKLSPCNLGSTACTMAEVHAQRK